MKTSIRTINQVVSKEWQIILLFALAKLLIHFLTFSNYELHRDAYLYYAQSEHLAWGYFSAPPATALIGKLSTLIFGNTTFALRFFPALAGALDIIIIGFAVKELGGKRIAISLASLAFLLSPAYLHVNTLFQPIAFNHFYWLLSAYLFLLMIKRENPKIWIWIAIVFGIGFLHKYSIVFLYVAFACSLLISRQRFLFQSKYFIVALFIGIAIISPNLIWQNQNGWPVLMHMSELRNTQLVHVHVSDFLTDQLLMNVQGLILWIGALLILLFKKAERRYRLFAHIYIIVIVILLLGSGKSYYSLGIYPILFVFGAYFTEKYARQYLIPVVGFLVVSMCFCLYFSLSHDGIPFNTFEKAIKEDAFRWEDGEYHDLPQDMADMTGWHELGLKVIDLYLSLDENNRRDCDIFCDHYGQAGAVMFYEKEIQIPQPISFNDNFPIWAPDSLSKGLMIWVAEPWSDANPDTLLPLLFNKVVLMATIDNEYFREDGTSIYLCESPSEMFKEYYKTRITNSKER